MSARPSLRRAPPSLPAPDPGRPTVAQATRQVAYADPFERLRKGVAAHPVPLMVLARLAVASRWAGQGVGSGLLKDAMLRPLKAADVVGLRALVVHAKDDAARSFYESFDFILSPSDPMHLFVLLKDVRAFLGHH